MPIFFIKNQYMGAQSVIINKDNGDIVKHTTQQYKVGLYVAVYVNGNIASQGNVQKKEHDYHHDIRKTVGFSDILILDEGSSTPLAVIKRNEKINVLHNSFCNNPTGDGTFRATFGSRLTDSMYFEIPCTEVTRLMNELAKKEGINLSGHRFVTHNEIKARMIASGDSHPIFSTLICVSEYSSGTCVAGGTSVKDAATIAVAKIGAWLNNNPGKKLSDLVESKYINGKPANNE